MEPTGWIKLHRKILSNPLFKNPNYLVVWVHLLLRASYSERKTYFEGNLIDLKPGQIVIGYTQLASLTGLSRATCQRAVSAIRDRYAIDTQAGRGSTLISIKNWESYQETDTQASAERALYKEKRIKNKEFIIKKTIAKKEKMTSSDFGEFWETYPRKVGKAASERKFLSLDRGLKDKILRSLEMQKMTWEDPKFIPHPTTWLNQGRWDDEVETVSTPGSTDMVKVGDRLITRAQYEHQLTTGQIGFDREGKLTFIS